ncbi:MAG: glutaredoxin family protein [Thermotogaceae bacterium]|nr:glutaredoxin family protein [Thermotogaceae bacterium]
MHKVRLFLRLFFLIAFLLTCQGLIFPRPVLAQSSAAKPYKVVIYLFWGDGCPHCAQAKPFLNELTQLNANTELRAYEVYYVPENQELFQKMTAAYGFEPHGVPTIFIGNQYWEGYSDQIGKEIEAAVKDCEGTGCPDRGIGVIPGLKAAEPENQIAAPDQSVQQPLSDTIDLPVLGTVHLAAQSIWVSTALISFIDGVNPCSVWVLTMLLAITLHTGSRKRVLIIGLIFLSVTAGVYALFIAGLFTIFTVVNFVGWIQLVVALVALFFALVNIKDYFWYKEGISFTISDSKKPGIYQRMRKLVDASQTFWGLAGATVVLAAGVSLVEFSCTAGFPVLWTNLLVSQKVTALTFILLLLLYLFIYQLDEMVIFFTAVYTLKSSKLEEKYGRILKLIGGMLMLALAVVMLVKPALMNNLGSSLMIFGSALLATLLVLLIHRTILPRFGIRIGTELGTKTTSQVRRH